MLTHTGAPVLKSVAESVTGAYMDCHMMVSDPAKVGRTSPSLSSRLAILLAHVPEMLTLASSQWVQDVAEAGGKSYTFHLEATGPGAS